MSTSSHPCTLALTAALLWAAPAAAQPDPTARAQRNLLVWAERDAFRLVDSIADAEFRKDSLGSITVAVVNGRELVWAKSYGYLDRRRTQRATPETVYRIASVTKQVTAVALMQLVDRKVVRLSDPVDGYVPEIRTVRGLIRPPTLVQLATMTSGLARDPADQRKSHHGQVDAWMQTLFSALLATEAVSEPSTTYRYSNVGYAILGAAIARAAKTSYVDYVREHILRPLGMTSTDFMLSEAMRPRLATGVDYDVLVKDSLNYDDAAGDHRDGLGISVPSGGLYSTVGDLARLVSLELGFGPDSVLSAGAFAMRNAVPVASNPTLLFGYGLGTQVFRWADTAAVGHSGNLAGYTSQLVYDATRSFGVIVLRSAGGGEADASRLAGRAFRKLVSLERGGRP
ncbi:MAG TPA: serine hydrolase domain-containing protein [Gemmatimonadaceae bacterium]|nr:serine hydrolase domain-containing protein [Gemmatimonadaceae bacterium]